MQKVQPVRAKIIENIIAFGIGCITIWATRADDVGSILITGIFVFYLMLICRNQKDCIPVLLIFSVFKIVEIPIVTTLFTKDGFYYYLGFISLYDIALALSVGLLHNNDYLRKVSGANAPKRKIKQVTALIIVLGLCVAHAGLVALDTLNYQYTDAQPLLYGSFSEVRAILKMLEFLTLWGIYLDSQMFDHIRNQEIVSVLKEKRRPQRNIS